MFPSVNTRDTQAVRNVCEASWKEILGRDDAGLLGRGFAWLIEAFAGRNPEFEPLDTRYHDLEHTMQGTLCLAHLMVGWHRSGTRPPLDERAVRTGMFAILLHDTGYMKARGDRQGTGAKFTPIHVQRSADVAARYLPTEGFTPNEIVGAQSMIRCTGVNADIRALNFERPVDREVGCALATADLLGQMAAPDYPERLSDLFLEFQEAAAAAEVANANLMFADAADLTRKTPDFWEKHVCPRLETEFGGVYRLLNQPWPDGPNPYLLRVEANIQRIRSAGASDVRIS
ncbi:MAG: HD domain-containing protein [Verrucomicrobiales bacterium]|nr:HD domain-containing protein [Verrucomicrobiales bacterium]